MDRRLAPAMRTCDAVAERERAVIARIARTGAMLPSAEDLELRTRAALRQAWTRSRDGRATFEQRPNKVTMLRSLYMDQDTQPETDRLNEKAGPSMRGLLATSHWERLRTCGADGCVVVPGFASFEHDGIKVFAAPDLAYVQGGVLHVIDWKTGREDDTQATQVLLQMWWALEAYPELAQAAADGSIEIRGYLEYVTAGRTQPVEAADGFREQAAETVRAGVAQMRALQADPERNIPLERAAFERRESGLCRTCNFLSICA
jgi:hypothetical protein